MPEYLPLPTRGRWCAVRKADATETQQQSEEQRYDSWLRDQWSLWVGDAMVILRRSMHGDKTLMGLAEGRISAKRARPGTDAIVDAAGKALAGSSRRNAPLTAQEAQAATILHGRMIQARNQIMAILSPGDAPTDKGLVTCSPAGLEVCEDWDAAYRRLTATARLRMAAAKVIHTLGVMRRDPPPDLGSPRILRKVASEEQRMADADRLAERISP